VNRRLVSVFLFSSVFLFAAVDGLSQPLLFTKLAAWGKGSFQSVAVQNAYAYVANGNRLRLVNIESPTWPYLTGTCDTVGEANRVLVAGNYAYVTDDQGLNIIDVADPVLPKRESSYPTPGKAEGVFVDHGNAYVAVGSNGILILDIQDPAKPTFSGWYDSPGEARSVFIKDRYAYVADGAAGLQILDISNPSSPVLVSSFDTPGTAMDASVQGLYAYVADGAFGLQIIDVSDPRSPFLIGTWPAMMPDGSAVKYHRLRVQGVYAYLLQDVIQGQGWQIVNISNPASPARVGVDSLTAYDIDVQGSYAYIAADIYGLQVVDISDPSSPVFKGKLDVPWAGNVPATESGLYGYAVSIEEILQIFSLADISSPVLVGTLTLPHSNISFRTVGLIVKGQYAYILITSRTLSWQCQIEIIDVSDPVAPKAMSSILISGGAGDFVVKDGYAYVTSSGMASHYYAYLTIVDISNPSSPVEVGHVFVPNPGFVHVADNVAYIKDMNGLEMFDISDPKSPHSLGFYSSPDSLKGSAYDIQRIMVVDGYAYLAHGKAGLQILDISNPASPTKVSALDIAGAAKDIFISGGYAFIAAERGLIVVDVSNPLSPAPAGSYENAGSSSGIAMDSGRIYLHAAGNRIFVLRADKESDRPKISARPSRLYFGADLRGGISSPQSLWISNSGSAALVWSIIGNAPWLKCAPGSGQSQGIVTVRAEAVGLSAGTYTAQICIYDQNASNSPLTIPVTLNVYDDWSSGLPFGWFDTPLDGTTGVTGAVPVTGWVLDDIEATRIAIERDPVLGDPPGATGSDGLIYIGDAIFVEGARPDVEAIYPQFPLCSRGGWGYMLLTNMLPNDGNGAYKLYAYASDKEGHRVLLGTRTITCDNARAVKPFGTIDTPAQGESVSGNPYINFGWVLTPQPKTIPKNGSTITVWVDGVLLGALDTPPNVYDQFRIDVFTAFPDLNNSSGPVGAFFLDTTKYANGVHTIHWAAMDDEGAADGIGSRYFTIANTETAADLANGNLSIGHREPLGAAIRPSESSRALGRISSTRATVEDILNLPISFDPIGVKRGFNLSAPAETLIPDNFGSIRIEMRELERLEVDLGKGHSYRGYLSAGNELRSLPIGSTFDPQKGAFSWMPGPGFLGKYHLVFLRKDEFGVTKRIPVQITIKPKFGIK